MAAMRQENMMRAVSTAQAFIFLGVGWGGLFIIFFVLFYSILKVFRFFMCPFLCRKEKDQKKHCPAPPVTPLA
jgi:hypothetical protein